MLIAANLVCFIALLLLSGAAVARLVLFTALSGELQRSVTARAARAALLGALLIVVGPSARLLGTAWIMRDDEPFGPLLVQLARDTASGRWTAGLGVLGLVLLLTPARWRATAAVAGALAVSIGLASSGHATELEPAALWIALDAAHALGALLWIGGLALVVPFLLRSESGALLSRFAPVALTGASVAVVTGVLRTLTVLPSVDALVTLTYGRVLLLKLLAVGLVGWFGWRNYRAHAGRRTLDVARSRGLERRARIELALASVVIGLTAWLSTISPLD
jgi:putative copper export protein